MAQLVSDKGLGVVSFVVLVYFMYQAGKFANRLVENHLAHFQDSLDKLILNSSSANEKLDRISDVLERRPPGSL